MGQPHVHDRRVQDGHERARHDGHEHDPPVDAMRGERLGHLSLTWIRTTTFRPGYIGGSWSCAHSIRTGTRWVTLMKLPLVEVVDRMEKRDRVAEYSELTRPRMVWPG